MDFIETRIKLLIERSASLIPWTEKRVEIMSRLNESIQVTLLSKESVTPPHRFIIKMNSRNTKTWQSNPSWHQDLEDAYHAILTEYGIEQELTPDFTLIVKNSLSDKEIEILESEKRSPRNETHSVLAAGSSLPLSEKKEHCPLLLFGEDKEINLSLSVINIGRRNTNEIVIDDIRVSRTHAQIRKTPQGFFVFDAGSAGGTFVNGTRVDKRQLNSGDVISLGGYKFIYLNEEAECAYQESGSTDPREENTSLW
ncbi:MAG: FHA domain-containing protein [Ignavibacteriaceae bacterium]|nr:FHA domain-containing protein [Ignavibacteriaceae bacterium]